MEHAAGDSAEQLRLDPGQCGLRLILIASRQRRFDLLDEGADAADAGAVDPGAGGVAADAFLCLRRIRDL